MLFRYVNKTCVLQPINIVKEMDLNQTSLIQGYRSLFIAVELLIYSFLISVTHYLTLAQILLGKSVLKFVCILNNSIKEFNY